MLLLKPKEAIENTKPLKIKKINSFVVVLIYVNTSLALRRLFESLCIWKTEKRFAMHAIQCHKYGINVAICYR